MTVRLQASRAQPSAAPHTSIATLRADALSDGAEVTRFAAIGAPWTIEAPRPLDPALIAHVRARIDEFDATYSRFRPDSLVSQVASDQLAGPVAFPEDARILFDLYDRLQRLTDGAVDPLVGRQLELLGYDPATP